MRSASGGCLAALRWLSICCVHVGEPWRSRLRAVAPLPRRVLDPATDTLTQRKLQPLKEITNHGANYRAVHSVVAN